MLLVFLDKVKDSYLLAGQYSVRDGVLHIELTEDPGDDAAAYEKVLADTGFTPAYPELPEFVGSGDTLSYTAEFRFGGIRLTSRETEFGRNYISRADQLLGSAGKAGTAAGSLAGPGIAEVRIDGLSSETPSCEIQLENGGYLIDPQVDLSPDIGTGTVSWKSMMTFYNGKLSRMDESGSMSYSYLNTAPYGLVLITREGDICFYQDPPE